MLLLVHILGIVRKLFNFKDDGECDVAVVVASDEMCQVVSAVVTKVAPGTAQVLHRSLVTGHMVTSSMLLHITLT